MAPDGTMSDKPLHVRVAEALGWTSAHYRTEGDHSCGDIMIPDPERMRWKGLEPKEMLIGAAGCKLIPRYDTDWAATGPLIERFRIDVDSDAGWIARMSIDSELHDGRRDVRGKRGDTPLLAACNLILALSSAGKLPK